MVDVETTDKGIIEGKVTKERDMDLITGSLKLQRRIDSPPIRKLSNDKYKNNVSIEMSRPKKNTYQTVKKTITYIKNLF